MIDNSSQFFVGIFNLFFHFIKWVRKVAVKASMECTITGPQLGHALLQPMEL
jgi:hypothetical protein